LLLSGLLHESASSATLHELLSGGSQIAGNSRFSDWQLLHWDSTTGVNPSLSLIDVNPLTSNPSNPGLMFATTSQLSIAGINAIELRIQFRVDALAGSNSFTGHTLLLSGITSGSVGGITHVSDEMTSHVGADLGPTLVSFDNVSGVNQLISTSSFAPQAGMTIVTNVFITGVSSTDSFGLTSFIQQFAQNGPPVLAGDYNTNGAVDAADYVVWRKANINDQQGYNTWRAHFGESLGGGSGDADSVGVPEPAALALMTIASLMCWAAGGRKCGSRLVLILM
jgi:hypothetical protein